MPDFYTPASVATGIDLNGQFLLQLDSQQRYDNIFKDSVAPIDYKIPNFNQRGDYKGMPLYQLIDTNYNADALKKGLTSPDEKTRALAWDQYNKNEAKFPNNTAVGSYDEISAEPWQNKFKNDEFGFNPNMSQDQNEAYYYDNQYQNKSTLGKIASNTGKFLGRTLTGAVLKLGQGAGFIGAMAVGGIEQIADLVQGEDNHSFMTTVADNAMSRYLEAAEVDFKDRQTWSIYKPNNWDRKGFFSKLTDGAFWSDEVADGAAFLASAAVPGSLLGKIGEGVSILGKTINTANKVRNAIQRVVGLETLGDAGSVIYNTVSESAFEASGVYKNVKTDLKAQRDSGGNNFTDEEINSKAGESAAYDFKANLGILSASSLFENKFIFKPLSKALNKVGKKTVIDGVFEAGSNIALDEGATASVREASKNWMGKFVGGLKEGGVNRFARIPFYGRRAAVATVMEGFWEENAQLAAERVASNTKYYDDEGNEVHTEDSFLKQLGKQTSTANPFSSSYGKDPEVAASIGLGGLLGIVGGTVMSKALGGVDASGNFKFGRGERQSRIDEVGRQVDKYNKARMNFLSTQDIYVRDANGNVIYDDKNPRIDKAKVTEKIQSLTDYGYRQLKSEQIEDDVFRNKLQKDLFAEYMAAAVRAGVDDNLIKKLTSLPSMSKESIKNLGFDPEFIKTDVATLLENAKALTKAYKDIYSVSAKPQKKATKEEQEKEATSLGIQRANTFSVYEAKEELRKYHAYLATARTLSSKDAYNEYEKKVLAEQNSARPGAFAPNVNLYDKFVHEYNSLTFEEEGLEQANNDFKGLNYRLMNAQIKERKEAIKKRKEELKTAIDEIPEAKANIRDQKGRLINSRKYWQWDVGQNKLVFDSNRFDTDNESAIKRAELKIDTDLNATLAAKLIDKNKGLDNYDEYRKYLAERQLLDTQADEKQQVSSEEIKRLANELEASKLKTSPFPDSPASSTSSTTAAPIITSPIAKQPIATDMFSNIDATTEALKKNPTAVKTILGIYDINAEGATSQEEVIAIAYHQFKQNGNDEEFIKSIEEALSAVEEKAPEPSASIITAETGADPVDMLLNAQALTEALQSVNNENKIESPQETLNANELAASIETRSSEEIRKVLDEALEQTAEELRNKFKNKLC